MNSQEQRSHKRVTDELSSKLDEVQSVVADLQDVVNDQISAIETLRSIVNDERIHRLKLADEHLEYLKGRVDTTQECCDARWLEATLDHKQLHDRLEAFYTRGFVRRLRWLFLGP